MVIVNGVVHTMDGPVIPRGFVAWRGREITAVGGMDALPPLEGEQVVDARGGHIAPGFIDGHTHLGLFPDGGPYDPGRWNAGAPVAPDFSPLERFVPGDRSLAEALAAGVTTAVTGPGSKNPVGGQMICLKTAGECRGDMVLRAPLALKMALGETPEKTVGTHSAGLAALLRESLAAAEDGPLAQAKGGRLPVHIHVHRARDVAAALALQKEFGLRLTLIHGTQAPQMARELAQAGVSVISGPALTDRSRSELGDLAPGLPAQLAAAGVPTAICTDHPETPAWSLPLCAAVAVRGGMDREEALAAITRVPAEILGLGDRLGALAPGMEADIVVTPGHPIDPTVTPSAVILGGRRVV